MKFKLRFTNMLANRMFPRLNPRARSLGFDDPFEDIERELFNGVPGVAGGSIDPLRPSEHVERLFLDLAPLLGMPIFGAAAEALPQKQAPQGPVGEERASVGGQVAVKPVPPQQVAGGEPHRGSLSAYARAPPVDIVERPNEYLVHLDVPGVLKEDIKIQLTQDRRGRKLLTVNGERKEEHLENEMQGFRSATALYGPFSRSLRLPKNVNTENITAKCENGVLCIAVPKMEPKAIEQPPPQEIRVD